MKCKNCECEIYNVMRGGIKIEDYVHEKHEEDIWYKCKCGCEKPEPIKCEQKEDLESYLKYLEGTPKSQREFGYEEELKETKKNLIVLEEFK